MMSIPFKAGNFAAGLRPSARTTAAIKTRAGGTTTSTSAKKIAKCTNGTCTSTVKNVLLAVVRRNIPIGHGASISISCVLFIALALFQGNTIVQILSGNQLTAYIPSAETAESISLPIALVPIDSIFPCNGRSERVVCDYTFLIDSDRQNHSIPESTNDKIVISSVCDDLLRVGTKRILAAPVCLQTPYTLDVLVYQESWMISDNSTTKVQKIQFVDKSHKIAIKQFLDIITTSISSKVKRIYKKKIEFPKSYTRINDITNTISEPGLDGNYGNMVWRYGATLLINSVTTEYDPTIFWNADIRKNDTDALVIAEANAIHLSPIPERWYRVRFEARAKYMQARRYKVIVLGIGAQQNFEQATTSISSVKSEKQNYYDMANRTDVKLPHAYQYEFLKEISDHQSIPAIGVRGDFTRSACVNSGIDNCVSTGCPSLTISRDINLGLTLHNNWKQLQKKLTMVQGDQNIRIAIGAPGVEDPTVKLLMLRAVATILSRYSKQTTLITQSFVDQYLVEQYIRNDWKKLVPTSTLHKQKINVQKYTNVESWLADAKTKYDLCISFRIHGSMTFISSGIPTIVIPSDYRIMELVSAMKIPHVVPDKLQELLEDTTLLHTDKFGLPTMLLNNANYTNFTEFEINRREKIKLWTKIVNEAGLEIDPALTNILTSPL